MMTSSNPENLLVTPELIQGGLSGTPSAMIGSTNFSFIPIGPAPPAPSMFSPPLVRPTVNTFSQTKPGTFNKRKSVQDSVSDMNIDSRGFDGPQRKMHLSDELVADTMADLYISHPRAKVARRKVNSDVAHAINLSNLEDLEDKFSSQAAINNDEFSLPPQRSRKLPTRSKAPQLRLSIHQELKNLRSSNAILPESIMSRYRPAPRSTAVVLWKPPPTSLLNGSMKNPPGGVIPDVVSSALRNSRQRTRCYSEVTSTPYSSHENLCHDSDMPDISERGSVPHPCSSHIPATTPPSGCAEAPELSHVNGPGEVEVPSGVNLHRRNSAPEISEPLPFVDDGSMEL